MKNCVVNVQGAEFATVSREGQNCISMMGYDAVFNYGEFAVIKSRVGLAGHIKVPSINLEK